MTSPERSDISCMCALRDGLPETYIVRYTIVKNSSLFFRFQHIPDTYRHCTTGFIPRKAGKNRLLPADLVSLSYMAFPCAIYTAYSFPH